ncbi:DUF7093 family protein [Haloarcula nitratireducens]|uniref:Uncharacterized protein n=1 Tax=Haloarcula nitratireducens TaxID=2487749 RepID=A0AAW4PD83_9EURY|nr:hypothetical protein [Halomicroarcula nitratireducens]MBX0295212.1 hypothetical protein [Halomicroarcula nitratireducens]
MGLKCSVLGHTYGETTVEREREEQGSEVVITIQERETCERCGKTRIVSENKEVTSIETPADIAGDMVDDGDESEPAADEESAASSDAIDSFANSEPLGSPETETDEAERDDGEDSASQPETAAGADVETETETEAVEPDADDAEILDDSDDDDRRGDSELENPTTDVTVSDAETGESVTDDEADPETDDAVIIDGDEDDAGGTTDREPGQWPEEPGDDSEDDGWRPETDLTAAEPVDGSAAAESEEGEAITVPAGQFRCPECGFTTGVEASSLREGDFCPECHRGTLVTGSE